MTDWLDEVVLEPFRTRINKQHAALEAAQKALLLVIDPSDDWAAKREAAMGARAMQEIG